VAFNVFFNEIDLFVAVILQR